MKNNIFSKALALIICLIFCFSFFTVSAENSNRVVDNADLLTPAEEKSLLEKLNSTSETHQVDVVIVTEESIGYQTPATYADDYFDNNGYGYGINKDGVLLLLNMESRDWYISTCGLCIDAFTDYDIETIGDLMLSDLSDGNYFAAFETYADECEYYINGYINGFPFSVTFALLVSLILGLIVAFIVTAIMKGQLKTIRPQRAAANYVRKGSMQVTESNDFFLYRQVSRIAKPKNNSSSTHRSSSGTRHGGGGGKF